MNASMKPTSFLNLFFLRRAACAALWLIAIAPLCAQEVVRYNSQPLGSKVRIEGTSTVHDWTMEGTIIGGFMEVPANFPESAAKAKVEAIIPVRSIKSGKKRMDEVMQEKMKQPQNPTIEYRLIELTPKSGTATAAGAQFDAKGLLKIAGVTRTNTMPVTIQRVDPDKLKISGSTGVKMTDFGIAPVDINLVIGHITTGDDVKVVIEWLTAKAAAK
jgi:polyisoprenoid-binding protein YceI